MKQMSQAEAVACMAIGWGTLGGALGFSVVGKNVYGHRLETKAEARECVAEYDRPLTDESIAEACQQFVANALPEGASLPSKKVIKHDYGHVLK